jgi:transposase-like protein
MSKYCKQDVDTLEEVYHKLKQYDKTLPDIMLFEDADFICRNCGSSHLTKMGFVPVRGKLKRRYRCMKCGTTRTKK